MASGQQLHRGTATAWAKDFEYEAGMWEKPTKEDEPAKLIYGDRLEATIEVDTYALSKKPGHIHFIIGKPNEDERCFGWDDSHLTLKAVMGSKSTEFDMGYMYAAMEPGKVSHFGGIDLDMSENNDPVHKKLHFILSDADATPKAGLHFYRAWITQDP